MKDRVPLYPGRVIMTPVPGQANTFDMVRADEPQEVGTPLNKAHLFTDETAQAFRLSEEEAFPDMGFRLAAKTFNNLGNIHIWSIEDDYGNYEYAVSHERDGYQEGGVGELPAEIITGELQTDVLLGSRSRNSIVLEVAYTDDFNNIKIADDGTLSIEQATSLQVMADNNNTTEILKGKYFYVASILGTSDLAINGFYYIPEDATINYTWESVSGYYYLYTDKLYKVTGLPKREEFYYSYIGRIGDILNVTVGTYTGDSTKNRKILLPFTPRAVYVAQSDGMSGFQQGNFYYVYSGFALKNFPVAVKGVKAIEITDGGFIVTRDVTTSDTYVIANTNQNGVIYHYIAIR